MHKMLKLFHMRALQVESFLGERYYRIYCEEGEKKIGGDGHIDSIS